ncbi:P60-like protein [Amylocystis lapponica]|nr:P60-like protein [Amylocystis lapponica]
MFRQTPHIVDCLFWQWKKSSTAIPISFSCAIMTATKSKSTASVLNAKKTLSSIGAPAQRNQGSRKGKRAWRKNVDIEDVEEGMEGLRAEERVTGTILQKQTNDELFQVDVKGDDRVRKAFPKFSREQLTSTKILAQRSAVPAVFSRTIAPSPKRRLLTHEEKGRLLRMGKRARRGPFDAVMDPTELGAGSAMLEVSEAARESGGYDVWSAPLDTQGPSIKHPRTPHPRTAIMLPAVPPPHEGASYNPLFASHQELLRSAHEAEERRVKAAEELSTVKARLEEARKSAVLETANADAAPGMTVDKPGADAPEDDADGEAETEASIARRMPVRKTRQERQKAARQKAEKRVLAERVARKRMLAAVDSAKVMRRSLGRTHAERERLRAQREQEAREKLTKGLVGQKIGKHRVPEGQVDVQLGDELSESLRALKPEGNLFRDRFLSMQHRAIIEPRVPVMPKKRRTKIKEYEKHAWKRFDLEQ